MRNTILAGLLACTTLVAVDFDARAYAQQPQRNAQNSIHILGTYGEWVTMGGNNMQGTPVCSAATQNSAQQTFTMVVFKGSANLLLVIADPSWQTNPVLEPGDGEKISLNFEDDEYWQTDNGVAGPHPIPSKVDILLTPKDRGAMTALFNYLDSKRQMEVNFVWHEKIAPLPFSLRGSSAAVAKMMECVKRMRGPSGR